MPACFFQQLSAHTSMCHTVCWRGWLHILHAYFARRLSGGPTWCAPLPPSPPAAPFLLSSLQFFCQHIIARSLLMTGLVRRRSDGSQSWRDYARKGATSQPAMLRPTARADPPQRMVRARRRAVSCQPALLPSCAGLAACQPLLHPPPPTPHPHPHPGRRDPSAGPAARFAVVPNGVATGLDIGLSNYSLVYITLSFYVMCKSTTPLFLLVFAIAWGIEKPSWCGGAGPVLGAHQGM